MTVTTARADALRANERAWEAHTAAEFVTTDVDATMATMTEDPVVVHVATSVGARGREEVRQFYTEHFIGHQASDMTLRQPPVRSRPSESSTK